MKILAICGEVVVIFILIMTMGAGCTTIQQQETIQTNVSPGEETYATVLDAGDLETKLSSSPDEALSTEEVADLRYMQEEERLARDVYDVFYEKWDMEVFKNI